VEWQAVKPPADFESLLKGQVPGQHAGTYRPLRSFYYAFAQYAFGKNVLAYHLLSLVINIACTVMVYKIIAKLTNSHDFALIASLLFAVHPIHTEAITFITTSFDEIGSFWGLAAFHLFLKHEHYKPAYYYSLLAFVLAVFSYEISLIIPLLLLSYLILLTPPPRINLKKTKMLIPYFFITIVYFIIRIFVLNLHTRGGYIGDSLLLSMFLSLKQIPIYILESFFPYHLGLDHYLGAGIYSYNLPQYVLPHLISFSFLQSSFILPLLFLICYIWLILKFRLSNPIISFGLVWILISLLPVLNIFPGYLMMFEKYLYIASFGSCLVMAWIFKKYWMIKFKNFKIIRFTYFLLLLSFMVITFLRNLDWQSDIKLWEKTSSQSPQNPMVWYMLGNAFLDQSLYLDAQTAYLKGLSLDNDRFFIHTRLGMTLYHMGDIQQSMSELNKVLMMYPQDKEASWYLGKIFTDYGDFTQAETYYLKAFSQDPKHPDIKKDILEFYIKKGSFFVSHGLFDEAIASFEKAIELDPDYEPAKNNLSKLKALLQDQDSSK